jgi:hypothetical protein
VRRLCALCLAIAIAAPAHAEPAHAEPVSAKRRAAAVALAIGPGLIVHGIGSWTVREKPAAKTLLKSEIVAGGVVAVAGLLVGGTGGNPYTIIPGVPLLVAGGGLLLQSWWTDIWVAAGGSRIAARPRALVPWSVELGTSWQHDAYRERALMRAGGDVWFGRVGASASALLDAGGDAKLALGNVHVRLLGADATGDVVEDNSRVVARLGTRIHVDDDDRTSQWTQEVEVSGRLDLARVDRAFRASFAELGVGIGAVRTKYSDAARDWSSELLGHFSWGAYLGERGEAKLFYEHTRDGLIGGFPAGRAAGFLGHLGAAADVRVWGPWAVRGEIAIGTAYLTTLAISYRGGPR